MGQHRPNAAENFTKANASTIFEYFCNSEPHRRHGGRSFKKKYGYATGWVSVEGLQDLWHNHKLNFMFNLLIL